MARKLQTGASTLRDARVSEGVGLWKLLGQASVLRLGKLGLMAESDSPGALPLPSSCSAALCRHQGPHSGACTPLGAVRTPGKTQEEGSPCFRVSPRWAAALKPLRLGGLSAVPRLARPVCGRAKI